jgi:hypothetical protein
MHNRSLHLSDRSRPTTLLPLWKRLATTRALVACGLPGESALAGDHNGTTQDRSNRTSAAVLKDIFDRAGTIDGKPIQDFQLRSRCQTAFITADSIIVIDWSHVGNYAGRYADGQELFAIDDGKGSHTIAVPAGEHPEPLGNDGARVDSGMSVIAR